MGLLSGWRHKFSPQGQQALAGAEGAEEKQGHKNNEIPATITWEAMAVGQLGTWLGQRSAKCLARLFTNLRRKVVLTRAFKHIFFVTECLIYTAKLLASWEDGAWVAWGMRAHVTKASHERPGSARPLESPLTFQTAL